MTRISNRDLLNDFDAVVDRVVCEGDRVVIVHDDPRRAVAIVSMEDLRLLEELEDRLDHATIQQSLAESEERIPWNTIKKEAGF